MMNYFDELWLLKVTKTLLLHKSLFAFTIAQTIKSTVTTTTAIAATNIWSLKPD